MNIETISKKITSRDSTIAKNMFPHSYRRALSSGTTKKLDTLFFCLLKELKIKSLIECGANEASASMTATKIGLKALAIEANPETFHQITPKPNDNFSKLNFGLSDCDGSLNFYMPQADLTAGNATFRPKKGVDYAIQKVQTKKLDDLLYKSDYVERAYALWIDVEGMQKEVLTGAAHTLQDENCKIIKIEVEEKYFFNGQAWLSHEVFDYLKKLGYDLIFKDFEYEFQYNLLFVKSDIAEKIQAKFLSKFFNEIEPISIIGIMPYIEINIELKGWVKAIFIQVLGERLGHKIASAAGSTSSKERLNLNK